MEINKTQRKAIINIIDDLYTKFKARVLGRKFRGPRMYFEMIQDQNPLDTLEGMFRFAYLMQRGTEFGLDQKALDRHMDIANNYIDAHRLKTQNEIINSILSAESEEDLGEMLEDKMEQSESYLNTLLVTEVRNAQSSAEADGISQAAASLNIDDPTVVKLGVIDNKMCKNCKKLWHHETNINKPKAYKLSELKSGYNTDHKQPKATVGSTHPNCYDSQTEVLTSEGWKLFKDLSGSELFLSVNPITENAEWVKSKQKVKYFHNGDMFHITNRGVDILTTLDHSHYIYTQKIKKIQEKTSLDLLKRKDFRTIHCIPKWIGEISDTITIGATNYNTNDFMEFMGYWLAEGCLTYGSKNTVRVEISQEKHVGIMQESFRKMFGVEPYCKHGKIIAWINKDHDLAMFLSKQGRSHEKTVPDIIKERSVDQIDIFLKAFALGDGSVRERDCYGYKSKEVVYFTSSDQMASDLGEIILKCGRRPSYNKTEAKLCKHNNGEYMTKHPCWVIRDRKHGFSDSSKLKKEIVKYKDFVYDVELEKNHTLFVRRNGKVALSGNCRHILTFVPPNFGFDDQGNIQFISFGYDYYSDAERQSN